MGPREPTELQGHRFLTGMLVAREDRMLLAIFVGTLSAQDLWAVSSLVLGGTD